jgi:hypothetical protein
MEASDGTQAERVEDLVSGVRQSCALCWVLLPASYSNVETVRADCATLMTVAVMRRQWEQVRV